MDIDKELNCIFDDPLLNISNEEATLFELPEDMKAVIKAKTKPDFVAQRKLCDDFNHFAPLFQQVHLDLKEGRRSLLRITKTTNLQKDHYYFVEGQLLLLQDIGETTKGSNGLPGGRTRCIYENGTESNILLQTLRKAVVGGGYAVTETQKEMDSHFFNEQDIHYSDKVTGYIYVLKSLSDDPQIKNVENLYKIGFSTNPVEQRVANAVHEPTYLMAPVKIVSVYKIVNMNSHKFEDLLHQVISSANFQVTVTDDNGEPHEATEWYVVPLEIVDSIIQKIMDGSIIYYTYNKQEQCLEQRIIKKHSKLDLKGLRVLTLNIKKENFDPIIKGEKTEEYRELKQTTLNKYTYIDEADGKRYLRRYDVLHLFVGYHKDRESAVVQILDTTYDEGIITYHLGKVLEVTSGSVN